MNPVDPGSIPGRRATFCLKAPGVETVLVWFQPLKL
jgi:hypothetical protein